MAYKTYFKFADMDLSDYVSVLKVSYKPQFKSSTNVNYDTTVDYINTKRIIDVEFIPMSVTEADAIIKYITTNESGLFQKQVFILEPKTQALEELAVIPGNLDIEYYTINATKQRYKSFKIQLTEL